jgi:hypothetical protein
MESEGSEAIDHHEAGKRETMEGRPKNERKKTS